MKTKLSKQEILERVGTMAQLAGIRPYVLREGRKNGVSAADLWNGSGLSMTVLSDRASDIYSVTYQGRSLCWLSGVGASGPWFAHNGPFEWDKNFGGGMLATCGLTTAGLPSADAGETLNLHGDIANLPAEEVNCRTFWEGDDYWLEYSSRTYQAKPYAENLCLTRQIRMRMGDNTIYLHDRVENLGFSATPLMLIYHMNFGYPLLDEGAKLYLTYQDRFPTSDLASQTVDQIGRVTPPDKSTLFNVITGMYNPTEGKVEMLGQDVTGWKPYRITELGFSRTFQNIRLFPRMTVQDNVIVGMHTRTKGNIFSGVFFTKKEKEERASCVREADTILRLLGLYEDRFEMGTSLPYGSQRKLEIARALATRPKLLLLDEPAAGMNEQETEELRQIVYRLKEMGYTILLIEHDMKFVMNICERIYVLNNGCMISSGTPDEVRTDPVVIEAYLGKEE